jgi:hypothetical protein
MITPGFPGKRNLGYADPREIQSSLEVNQAKYCLRLN